MTDNPLFDAEGSGEKKTGGDGAKRTRTARAKTAKPAFELATRVRDASVLRLADARRRRNTLD